MEFVRWLLFGTIIVIGFLGGYYQLQMLGYLKDGCSANCWMWGWLYNLECLKEDGMPFRKKLLICYVIALFDIIIIKIFRVW